MLKIFILITLWFASCKPLVESQVQTNSAEGSSLEELKRYYRYNVEFGTSFSISNLKKFETRLTKAIDNNPQQHELRKIRHKVRGFIIQLLTCAKPKKDDDPDRYSTAINDQSLCSLIAHKLQAMTPQIIDIEQIDEDFYYQVFLAGKYHVNKVLSTDKQQLYRDLLVAIARTNDASMEKYSSMWPFAKIDWFMECQQANMRSINASQRMMSIPSIESLQKNSHCQQLKGHVPQALAFDQQVLVYPNIEALTDHLRHYVMRLNVLRYAINKQLRLKSKDPAVKKESIFWVIRDVIHMTEFKNHEIVKLYELYYATLIEVAQQRLLPILLAIYQHQLYLNPKGRLFGLTMPRHDELKYPNQEMVQRSIGTITNKLASHYLQITEARENRQEIKDEHIYKQLIHNEIAAAQIILQNPRHAFAANHLIHVYQNKFRTPKWLQNLKSWSHRLDIIMIPASIIGSIVAAKYMKSLVPVITNAAIAINFFWIASATADTVVAFRRYQIVERALISGTSIDARRGIAYANELKDKINGAIVAVGLGGGLTIKALKLANKTVADKKAHKWAVATDISAALLSELPTGGELNILGDFTDGTTDKEEHNKNEKSNN